MSEMRNKSIEFILHELTQWIGSEITIEKKERGDFDKNKLSLSGVEIVKQITNEDDYVDPYTIQLQGKGTVEHEEQNATKLPLNSYELPIRELVSVEAANEFVIITTDRGTYELKRKI